MTTDKRRGFLDLEKRWLVLPVLLLVYGYTSVLSLDALKAGRFPDSDDALRLVQVRDWLAGQSWFDVNQYRMNPPDGAPMHWSRIVDLPIAMIILLFRPFVGQSGAETAALILVPMVTLGLVMALAGEMARKLIGPRAALLTIVATPFSLAAMTQLRPMRIDHHGWQIVMGLIMAVAVFHARPRLSAAVAGAAAAVWLNISIEGLPFTAAVGIWFGLLWLRDQRNGERLRYYMGALAACSILLFIAMKAPSAWPEPWCDSVSPAYLAALAVAGLICAVAVRPSIGSWPARAAILAVSAMLAAAALFVINPQCAGDPFGALDPVVRRYWHDRVMEGLPLWRQSPDIMLVAITQPIVGAFGAAIAWRRSSAAERPKWVAYLFLLGTSTLAGILVLRAAGLASVISLVGTAYLADWALTRARQVGSMLPRVAATFLSLGIMAPAYAVPLLFLTTNESSSPSDNAASTKSCQKPSEIKELNQLPASILGAPLDLGTSLLVHTHHRVIASPHHRNTLAMRDVIRFFMLRPEQARSIAAARQVDYVVVCPSLTELSNYAREQPSGLWAQLQAGKAPDWLEPVKLRGVHDIRIWRVRKERLGGAAATVRNLAKDLKSVRA